MKTTWLDEFKCLGEGDTIFLPSLLPGVSKSKIEATCISKSDGKYCIRMSYMGVFLSLVRVVNKDGVMEVIT